MALRGVFSVLLFKAGRMGGRSEENRKCGKCKEILHLKSYQVECKILLDCIESSPVTKRAHVQSY